MPSLILAVLTCLFPLHGWEVDEPHAPSVVLLEQSFREGTWISVDVSPDGERLAFDLLGHIYVMPFAGGQAQAITSGRSWNMFPRWSPDGRSLAFTSDQSGVNALWICAPDGSSARQVSDGRLPVFQGTWASDGRALYGTRLDLKVGTSGWRYGLHGSTQELLPTTARFPVNDLQDNPVDGRLYWVIHDGSLPGGGPRVAWRNLETGEDGFLVQRPGGAAAARLSPDGTRLAYVHREDQATELVLRDLVGGSERTVATGLDRGRFDSRGFYGAYSNISWHPDGRRVVFSRGGGLGAVDVDSGQLSDIPFEAPVRRELDATLRFPVELPSQGVASTRSHRWASRTPRGVLYETLGDLWLLPDGGGAQRLTESDAHETEPLLLPDGRLAWCSFSDDDLGAVWVGSLSPDRTHLSARMRLPGRASQYGALASALSPDGRVLLAAVAGADDLLRGTRLEDQTQFELVLWELPAAAAPAEVSAQATAEVTTKPRPTLGSFGPFASAPSAPRLLTHLNWIGNRYSHRPPGITLEPERGSVLFSEYLGDELQLKRVDLDGGNERTLYVFPNATRALVSPDRRWIAFREHHRSWLTPFEPMGSSLSVSATDEEGLALRVDDEDGDFMVWSPDSQVLSWTRGQHLYEKTLAVMLTGGASRRRTALAVDYPVFAPDTLLALRGVTVLSMDGGRRELEDATVLVRGPRIEAVGTNVPIPTEALVLDLPGRVVMPGLVDAHGHYGSEVSVLNVIEQRPYGLAANLAHGVTTMVDVYGTTQKDFWLSDMLQAGKVSGPRLLSVGDPIFVTRYRSKMFRPIESYADALEHARFNAAHGATVLKDYSNHRRDARQQLAAAARSEGLNLVAESFNDPQMNLTQVVDGFTGLEHTLGLEHLYADAVALFGASQVGMTPTLIVLYNGPAGEGWFHQRERVWEDSKLLQFYRQDELLRLRRPTFHFDDEWSLQAMGAALRKLHDAGTLLTVGAHGQMMGLGAHWELELLTLAGFAPREALAMGTIEGATHHGLDGSIGSVEPGKLADLLVLSADPRVDIRNSRQVEFVLINGALYDGADGSRVLPSEVPYRPTYNLQQR